MAAEFDHDEATPNGTRQHADLCAEHEPALQGQGNEWEFLKPASICDLCHSAAEWVGRYQVLSPLVGGVAVPTAKRFGDSVYGTRRATYGVVVWIAILLVGYWLLAEWQSLPALASSLLAPLR